MDDPRHTSPQPMRALDFRRPYSSYGSTSRTSLWSSDAPLPTPSSAIPMPNAPPTPPPPALPPPRFTADLAVGRDPGYYFGNRHHNEDSENGMPCVSPISSLRGNWNLRREEQADFEQDEDDRRRGSSSSTLRSPSFAEFHASGGLHHDEGYHSLSGSSLAQHLASSTALNYRLKGERHLERQNRKDSSHAYDKHLLDKIGRPQTPPRSSTMGSLDASPGSKGPFFHPGKPPPSLKSTSFSDGSFGTSSASPFKAESVFGSKWASSPQSAGVSPSLLSNGVSAKRFSEYRSPTFDGMNTPQSATEPDRFPRVRHPNRRSESSGSITVGGFNEEGVSALAKSKRAGSYDQGIFMNEDLDSDFPIEETRRMRRLHIDDRPPPSIDVHSPDSRLGIKRGASSPLRESPRDAKAPLQTVGGTSSELYQRRTSGHHSANRASPVNRYHPTHGSVSPSSSVGIRHGSHASSAGLSVGASSITTSGSSFGRLSPRGISPLPEQPEGHDSQYLNSTSSESSLQSLAALTHQHIAADTKSAAALARKMSTDNTNRGKQSNAPKMQANIHICQCCPKKPKKFDTVEELRNHQNEKQYFCRWCHNRFKNKNEAERHQNSLHLRRHSWSCATLDRNYEAAFHPNNAIPPNTNASHTPPQPPGIPAQSDVCGYCGEEFSNIPTPDWNARGHHLTSVHKFGECNQGKKFYRADHFRQHLKHSHGGTSGKWTNMLENSCMKEEPHPTPESQSQEQLRQQAAQAHQEQQQLEQQLHGAPVANMMGGVGGPVMRQGPYNVMGMGMPGGSEMQHTRIDEEMPEEM